MKPMRRADRQVTDPTEILAILTEEKVCRLAMVDEAGAYIVPLNFGYTLSAQSEAHTTEGLPQALTLYFHSASSGHKIDALRANSRVCFEIDGAHQMVLTEAFTDCSYHYHSIIGSGEVEFITDSAARMDAMVALMQQQSGMMPEAIRAMPRDERWMKNEVMAVFALRVGELSAKRHG
ncbi:MAG: pyridoxamine 5'-phosphate oxidase family protein [Faecalibacterium sp.]